MSEDFESPVEALRISDERAAWLDSIPQEIFLPINKKYPMSENLEERTEEFAVAVRAFVRALPRTVTNIEDVKQLARSSGSVAANYIEANESLGGKDKLLHFKICRKEAKESGLWLRLVHIGDNPSLEKQRQDLRQEARELTLIFAAILRNIE